MNRRPVGEKLSLTVIDAVSQLVVPVLPLLDHSVVEVLQLSSDAVRTTVPMVAPYMLY